MKSTQETPILAATLAFIGGACGSGLRVASDHAGAALDMPVWGSTLAVNVVACFLGAFLGRWLLGRVTRRQAIASEVLDPYAVRAHRLTTLLVTGFCGGLSTFSALGQELHELVRLQQLAQTLTVAGLSLVLGLGSVWCGFALGMRLNRDR
jgi:CrcB protein